MAFKKPEGGIDFAAISAKMDEERKKIAAMTPEERQAYQQAKEDARMAEYRAQNDKDNEQKKADFRKTVLAGHVIGPIDITYLPAYHDNPLSVSREDRTIQIRGSISDKPPTNDPESDYEKATRFRLVLPEAEAEKILKNQLKNNNYNSETCTHAEYSAKSDEKLYMPVAKFHRKYRNTALEYNFGENKWPDLPMHEQSPSNKSFLLNPNITTPTQNTNPTPATNTTQHTALILVAPNSNDDQHAKTLIHKVKDTLKSHPQYTDIRVIGHNATFAQKIADDIQVLHPTIRTAALTHDKFRNMNNEQQTKTLEYIDKKTDILTHNDQTNPKNQLLETLKQSAATKNKQQDQSR